MTFDIHYTRPDGSEDCVRISADTEEEIRAEAHKHLARVAGSEPWSEEVK